MAQVTVTLLLFILTSSATVFGSPIPSTSHRLERRFSGKATWFKPNIGACGDTNSKSDYIVAMNEEQVSFLVLHRISGQILKSGFRDASIAM
jgi:hypothetical protein